jgi:hypothetical protein
MTFFNIYSDSPLYFNKMKSSYNLVGLYFIGQHYRLIDIIIFPFYLIKYFKSFLRRRRVLSTYRKIGVNKILIFEPNIILFIKSLNDTVLLFNKINSKKDVLKLNYRNIEVGDLIYDTYLRMFNRKTLHKNLDLFLLINRTISEIKFLENLKLTPIKFYTFYTSYTASGIPFRFFNYLNIDCYSFASNSKGKKHRESDIYHCKDFRFFKNNFNKLSNKNDLIKSGVDYMFKICNGESKYRYMKSSPFRKYQDNFNLNLDGVIFIHDLFDSQYIYGEMLFEDFYSWLVFTLEFTNKHNLKIGFKEHPNQKKESKKVIDRLKNEYKKNIWIDTKVSQSSIFNSGIKFGVSIYGSVLTELSFNKIKAISCGDNLTENYNFVFKPSSIFEYQNFLLQPEKLVHPDDLMNQIGEFTYMNYLND